MLCTYLVHRGGDVKKGRILTVSPVNVRLLRKRYLMCKVPMYLGTVLQATAYTPEKRREIVDHSTEYRESRQILRR